MLGEVAVVLIVAIILIIMAITFSTTASELGVTSGIAKWACCVGCGGRWACGLGVRDAWRVWVHASMLEYPGRCGCGFWFGNSKMSLPSRDEGFVFSITTMLQII